jgi:hypothetical protein
MKAKKMITILVLAGCFMLYAGQTAMAGSVGTAFAYQGRLIDANETADGLYDFQFKLFDANIDGNQVGGDVNKTEVDVIDGYFTVKLDFGGVFDGNERWLLIGVRSGELGDPNLYTSLSPRQLIAPTPYALYALNGGGSLWQSAGSNIYFNGGNVGIGTASPAQDLEVEGGVFIDHSGGAHVPAEGGIALTVDGRAGKNILRLRDSEANTAMVVNHVGKVGIGTSSPTAKLEVNGQVRITDGTQAAGKVLTSDAGGQASWQSPTETDPTVLASVKDGISWGEVSGIPAGFSDGVDDVATNMPWTSITGIPADFADNVDNGLIVESDPTVPAAIKDGVSWGEVSDIPAGFADGNDDVGGDTDWIISGNDMFSGVSGNVGIGTTNPTAKLDVNGTIKTAAIYETPIWIPVESSRGWQSVAMSADGTKQTAVAYNGQIYISTDSGNTWTAKESNREWKSVAMSADGTKQTAVAYNGQIYVSTDSGDTWTPKASNRGWYSVAMSADGTKQTAVASLGQIYISTDSGNTWTAKESNRGWYSVAMSADGTKQTAVASLGQIYISTDSGNTWTAKESSRYWTSVAMSADGTKQTAVASFVQIYISTDSGNTWTAKESNREWNSVAMSADGTKQTAGVYNGQIYISTDSGNTWSAKESNRIWMSVAMSADGTKQTAVATGGQIYVYNSFANICVGIGTTNPGAMLEVAGQVKITDGTQGAGKVLTSDSVGLATWINFSPGVGGDITAVNAGTGLSGGGTLGDVTLAVSVPLSLTGSAASPAAVFDATNTGNGYGVKGTCASSISGKGVYGYNSSSGNSGSLGGGNFGVQGIDSSGNYGLLGSSGYGVYGSNTSGNYGLLGGSVDGVYGNSSSGGGTGVSGASSTGLGVYGESSSNTGVYGKNNSSGNSGSLGSTSYGVYGAQANDDYWAGWFQGDVKVTQELNADVVIAIIKYFKIDHPLDPENKYLKHASVESSEMMNIYSGNITLNGNGEASVMLPEWFQALNKDFRYQLTCIGDFAPVYIAEKISENRFKIAGGKPGMEVSWQVTGVRQDPAAVANPLQVEENKPANERGYYLTPEVYGLPKEKGINMVGKGRPSKEQQKGGVK